MRQYDRIKLFIKFLWVLSLGILCWCCGPTHYQYTRIPETVRFPCRTVSVYLDRSFGEEDRLHIDDSIMKWNYAFNGYIVLKIVSFHSDFGPDEKTDVFSNHGLMIHKVNSNYPDIPRQKEQGLRTIAWTDMIDGHEIFLIRDRLDREDIFPVTLHELAHYFGAEHVEQDGLMNRQYTQDNYQCIDIDTIRQVARFNGIDQNNMNHCRYDHDSY